MFIPDPDFYSYRIPDQTTAPKEESQKFCLSYLFCSLKYHKIINNLIFEQVKKFFKAKHKHQKIVIKLLKIWVWDPGYEIRDPEKPYPGSGILYQKVPDLGSGCATLVLLTTYPILGGQTSSRHGNARRPGKPSV
jgi:hypothetical protein